MRCGSEPSSSQLRRCFFKIDSVELNWKTIESVVIIGLSLSVSWEYRPVHPSLALQHAEQPENVKATAVSAANVHQRLRT